MKLKKNQTFTFTIPIDEDMDLQYISIQAIKEKGDTRYSIISLFNTSGTLIKQTSTREEFLT